MKREKHWLDGIERIRDADTTDLRKLAELSSKNPAAFYRGADLRGVSFAGADLRGLRFNGAKADWTTTDDDTQSDCAFFWLSYFCYTFATESAIKDAAGLESVQLNFDKLSVFNEVSDSLFVNVNYINDHIFKENFVLRHLESYVQSTIKKVFTNGLMAEDLPSALVETSNGPKMHFTEVIREGNFCKRWVILNSKTLFHEFLSDYCIVAEEGQGKTRNISDKLTVEEIVYMAYEM